jgi:predicted transcriptional regulator
MKTPERSAPSAPLNELLRAQRNERSLSLREAARELGVDAASIRGWETGLKRPRADKAESLGRYLGMSTIDVLVLMGVLGEDHKGG